MLEHTNPSRLDPAPLGHCDGGSSSTEVPSSQVSLAFVKVNWNEPTDVLCLSRVKMTWSYFSWWEVRVTTCLMLGKCLCRIWGTTVKDLKYPSARGRGALTPCLLQRVMLETRWRGSSILISLLVSGDWEQLHPLTRTECSHCALKLRSLYVLTGSCRSNSLLTLPWHCICTDVAIYWVILNAVTIL